MYLWIKNTHISAYKTLNGYQQPAQSNPTYYTPNYQISVLILSLHIRPALSSKIIPLLFLKQNFVVIWVISPRGSLCIFTPPLSCTQTFLFLQTVHKHGQYLTSRESGLQLLHSYARAVLGASLSTRHGRLQICKAEANTLNKE
jgi:hypothetical protein